MEQPRVHTGYSQSLSNTCSARAKGARRPCAWLYTIAKHCYFCLETLDGCPSEMVCNEIDSCTPKTTIALCIQWQQHQRSSIIPMQDDWVTSNVGSLEGTIYLRHAVEYSNVDVACLVRLNLHHAWDLIIKSQLIKPHVFHSSIPN